MLLSMESLKFAITPEPTAGIRRAVTSAVVHLGGEVHSKSIHDDRISNPKDADAPPFALAGCGHRGTLCDVPDPGTGRDVRLCTVCDAMPRMPRIAAAAAEIVGS